MTIRSALWVIEQKILAEASKPKGVTFHELRDRRDLPLSTSRDHCRRLVKEGKIFCAKVKHGCGLRWFANKDHVQAFKAIQAKARVMGSTPFIHQGVQTGPAYTVDVRFHVPDTFRGEFSALRIGQYLEGPA